MTNSKRAVNAPDDLKGLKMRTMENPVHVTAYKGFGIVTTPMAFPEVFTALQQGTVDGQENPLSVIMAAKFDQVQKHLSLTGHVYSPGHLPDDQGRVRQALGRRQAKPSWIDAKEGVKANRARVDEDDAKGVAELRSKGMNVVENVDKAKFVNCAGPGVRRVRKAVRQGQHRPHPQLQVSAQSARSPTMNTRERDFPESLSSAATGLPWLGLRHAGHGGQSLGMFQIITRFVLEQPAEWTEVLIRFSLIWMVFMGIPMAFRQGAMVSVDVLYRWSPPHVKRVLDWVVTWRRWRWSA
jgi:hypothetical protein